jgi:hypothetical protein
MKITASNGQTYDLENLTQSDKAILMALGHLPKETAAVEEETTPSVSLQDDNKKVVKKGQKDEPSGL